MHPVGTEKAQDIRCYSTRELIIHYWGWSKRYSQRESTSL